MNCTAPTLPVGRDCAAVNGNGSNMQTYGQVLRHVALDTHLVPPPVEFYPWLFTCRHVSPGITAASTARSSRE